MAERESFLPDTTEELRTLFVGKTAPEAFITLIDFLPQVRTAWLISYIRGLKWEEGYANLEEQLSMGVAKEQGFSRREILKNEFWSERLENLKRIEVPKRSPVLVKEVETWYDEENDTDIYIALSSRVLVNGELKHFPLLDFVCLPSDSNRSRVKVVLKTLRCPPGLILDSGGSYHYWGLKTVYPNEWTVWIDNLKKWAIRNWYFNGSILDMDFLGCSSKDSENRLRLTSGIEKRETPSVVDVI